MTINDNKDKKKEIIINLTNIYNKTNMTQNTLYYYVFELNQLKRFKFIS